MEYVGKQINNSIEKRVLVRFDEFDPQDFFDAINDCLRRVGSDVVIVNEIGGGDYIVAVRKNALDQGCFGVSVDDPTDILDRVVDLVQSWDREWRGSFEMTSSPRPDDEDGESATLELTVKYSVSNFDPN